MITVRTNEGSGEGVASNVPGLDAAFTAEPPENLSQVK